MHNHPRVRGMQVGQEKKKKKQVLTYLIKNENPIGTRELVAWWAFQSRS